MKRSHFFVAAGLLAAGALFVGQSKVSPQAIASSVPRAPELVERAWQLPVAATFRDARRNVCGRNRIDNRWA
jgi:hypothetical protein